MSKDDTFKFYTTQTSRNLIRFLTLHLKQYDITPKQWTVLKRLATECGITQKELAQSIDKDPATVMKILDILERKQLLIKQPNKEDRRSLLLYATEKGQKLVQTLHPFIESLYEHIVLRDISEEHLEIFTQVLHQINTNISEELDQ
ncbi:MarR family transcriptional regulator [Aneurinibacillus soli]|uniref:Transcriptional regulator HosA n=1 Tax=Aneurinibacillus soli TaxID=1500254 RepID=A0A0U4WAK8_9BACL|nr:MarR family transcriptional regulator [Aneurinibacillus soli]PYE58059.1 MarR family transcriptional regulator [Aneurinibacillus soli]BAU25960.1 Transcriptional regulator HosA [Aneurinibacillus soli]